MKWHILTGEYPPTPGGVADYTQRVAAGLRRAGDPVMVWAPHVESAVDSSGVVVHGLPDHFGPRSFHVLARALQADDAQRLLVQYVPHAFGWKGGNLLFSVWLRTQRYAPVWVMFHEVAYPLDRRQRLVENGLGLVTHGMAAMVASAAERAFVSIPAWESMLRRVAPSTSVEWMPVPSSVDTDTNRDAIQRVRDRFAGPGALIGHFGTFGRLIRPLLDDAIPSVLGEVEGRILLIGRGSDRAAEEMRQQWPALASRVSGTGPLGPRDLSHHVAACDVLLQPYPDGISSRRTSAMAALAHGRPLATTLGPLSESLWSTAPGVIACPVADARALARACAALATSPAPGLSDAIRAFYASRFDLSCTIATLRGQDASLSASAQHAS